MSGNDYIKHHLVEEIDALLSKPLTDEDIREAVDLYKRWLDDIHAQQEEQDKRLELAELKLARIKSLFGEDDATKELTE